MSQPKPLALLLEVLEEMKAQDIKVLNVKSKTTISDYMVICTGRSSRHVKSVAENAIENLKKEGFKPISQTGFVNGDWVLIDFNGIILHVMQSDARIFYNLEGLWQESDI